MKTKFFLFFLFVSVAVKAQIYLHNEWIAQADSGVEISSEIVGEGTALSGNALFLSIVGNEKIEEKTIFMFKYIETIENPNNMNTALAFVRLEEVGGIRPSMGYIVYSINFRDAQTGEWIYGANRYIWGAMYGVWMPVVTNNFLPSKIDGILIQLKVVLGGDVGETPTATIMFDDIVLAGQIIESFGDNMVMSDEDVGISSEYELFQNYPNPFNPKTEIQFSISETEFVSLRVYNILGEEVAELVNMEILPGTHKAIFDASELSSGIYFYRLQAGNFVEIKKMSLLK